MIRIDQMTTSRAGLEAGMFREDFREKAYRCSARVWTFGYGSTYRYQNGERVPVQEGDTITREEAEELFLEQWREHERGIARAIARNLTQPQFDVLADMAFQLGENFLVSGRGGTTGLRDAINAGAWEKVDAEIARWHWADGRRDPGCYTRALARVCQWHALPWRWIYAEIKPETIRKDRAGRVIETPFMTLNPDGTVKELVNPETALARARAVDARTRAKAPPTVRVPPEAAPSTRPEITIKLPPGVTEKDIEDAPPPPRPDKPARKPVVTIGDPYKGAARSGLQVKDLHYKGMPPGAKPITESETFFGACYIVFGQVLLQMGKRGLFLAVLPSWASVLLIDALQDPFLVGILATVTAAAFTALAAAPALLKAGWRKMKSGRANAKLLKW